MWQVRVTRFNGTQLICVYTLSGESEAISFARSVNTTALLYGLSESAVVVKVED